MTSLPCTHATALRRGSSLIEVHRGTGISHLAADDATAAALAAVADAAATSAPLSLICTEEAAVLAPNAIPYNLARAFGSDGGAAVAAVVAVTDLGALDGEAARERAERAVKLRLEEEERDRKREEIQNLKREILVASVSGRGMGRKAPLRLLLDRSLRGAKKLRAICRIITVTYKFSHLPLVRNVASLDDKIHVRSYSSKPGLMPWRGLRLTVHTAATFSLGHILGHTLGHIRARLLPSPFTFLPSLPLLPQKLRELQLRQERAEREARARRTRVEDELRECWRQLAAGSAEGIPAEVTLELEEDDATDEGIMRLQGLLAAARREEQERAALFESFKEENQRLMKALEARLGKPLTQSLERRACCSSACHMHAPRACHALAPSGAAPSCLISVLFSLLHLLSPLSRPQIMEAAQKPSGEEDGEEEDPSAAGASDSAPRVPKSVTSRGAARWHVAGMVLATASDAIARLGAVPAVPAEIAMKLAGGEQLTPAETAVAAKCVGRQRARTLDSSCRQAPRPDPAPHLPPACSLRQIVLRPALTCCAPAPVESLSVRLQAHEGAPAGAARHRGRAPPRRRALPRAHRGGAGGAGGARAGRAHPQGHAPAQRHRPGDLRSGQGARRDTAVRAAQEHEA